MSGERMTDAAMADNAAAATLRAIQKKHIRDRVAAEDAAAPFRRVP